MLRTTEKIKGVKTAPWTGPFKILHRTKGGAYILETLDGDLHPTNAPPNLLKLVSSGATLDSEPSYGIDAILQHRETDSGYEYLVKWKGYGEDENTWEPFSNFNSIEAIQKYWVRRGKSMPTSQTRPTKRRQRLVGGDVDPTHEVATTSEECKGKVAIKMASKRPSQRLNRA